MTHSDVITFNECQNDGSTVHLYRNAEVGAWFAYGISAYLLKNICDANNINCIESYSDEIIMPSVTVSDIADIVDISKVANSDKSYYVFKSNRIVNDEHYSIWAMRLCGSFRNKIK